MSAKSHFPLPTYPTCDDWKRHHAGGIKMQTRTGQNEFRDQRYARLERLAQVGGPRSYVRAPPPRELDPAAEEPAMADPGLEMSTMTGKQLRQEARSMGMTKQEIQEMTREQLEARVSAGRRLKMRETDAGQGFSYADPGAAPAAQASKGLGTKGAQNLAKAQSSHKDNALPLANAESVGPAPPTAKQEATAWAPQPGYVDADKGLVMNAEGGWDHYTKPGTINPNDGTIMDANGNWVKPTGLDYDALASFGGSLYDTMGKMYTTAKEMKDAVEMGALAVGAAAAVAARQEG